MRRIVIVGAGLGAHRAAQALRREGFEGELWIIGDEAHKPYDRPPLSKQLLAGNVQQSDCFFACDGLDVEWALGQPATGLDTVHQIVEIKGGEELHYDGLVIATGRRARQWRDPPDLEGLYTLRSLDDALALRRAIHAGGRAVIVGAGFIGCEVAATLRGLGVRDVTLIDVAPYPMPALGPEIGIRAARLHEHHGVRLRMATSVARFEGQHIIEAVRLNDGGLVEADFVLLALGSIPNSQWLAGSGLALVNGAVLCDKHCVAIGTGNIVAAGDIAAYPHPLARNAISIEHWSNARDMGALAASNLLKSPDARDTFTAVPTFWSDQYDVKIKSAGVVGVADSFTVLHEDPERPALVLEAHRNGELVGAVVFNRNRTIIDYQRRLGSTAI